MQLPVTYVWTHDSIGLGEDGPTHQPIEHLASLRAIPNLTVLRPADTVETLEAWDIAREMSFRVAWKPYMYSQTLPHLLRGMAAPTLVVWGDDDRVVPRSAAEVYLQALPEARLEIVPACGHCAEMEKPEELARLVAGFVGTA